MDKIFNKDICPWCSDAWLVEHENSDLRYCPKCSYDEHYQETKGEIMFIINYLLKNDKWEDDSFMCPNGGFWTKDGILHFLDYNL